MSLRWAVAARGRLVTGIAALFVLLLAACASGPKPVAPTAAPAEVAAGWPARRAALQNRTQFTAQGRIAVAAGNDGFNGKLRWVQDGSRSTVSLDGPLGVGGVRIVKDGTALSLTNSSGQALDSQAAHDEMVRRMGFEPPLDSLRFWLQGVPDPSSPSAETPDAQGYLGSLQQAGWTVTYAAYMQAADGALPQRVTVTRDMVRVKLIIESWSP